MKLFKNHVFVFAIIFIFFVTSVKLKETKASDTNIYYGDGFEIETICEYTSNGKVVILNIKNVTDEPIRGWTLAFSWNTEIDEIWDANISGHIDDLYLINNNDYNSIIYPNGVVSFGMVISDKNAKEPTDFYIPRVISKVPSYNYSVSRELIDIWNGGYIEQYVITNLSEEPISGWIFELDKENVESAWGASWYKNNDKILFTPHVPGNKINQGDSYQIYIQSIGLYFEDNEETHSLLVSSCKSLPEALIGNELINSVIPITSKYFIEPLYSFDDEIEAFYICFYDDIDNVLSYVVATNVLRKGTAKCLEFGFGECALISSLKNLAMSQQLEYRLITDGRCNYFIKSDEELLRLGQFGLERVNSNHSSAAENEYYTFGNVLEYIDISNLEEGYDSVDATISSTFYSGYANTSDLADEVYKEYDIIVTNHCSPTAGYNFLVYLSENGYDKINDLQTNKAEVFMKLFKAMKTSNTDGTKQSNCKGAYNSILKEYGYNNRFAYASAAKWDKIVTQLDKGAVHIHLFNSEIYQTHATLGVGYIIFSHSTGWKSKYIQIVDGWGYDFRYVQYELGIDKIGMTYMVE